METETLSLAANERATAPIGEDHAIPAATIEPGDDYHAAVRTDDARTAKAHIPCLLYGQPRRAAGTARTIRTARAVNTITFAILHLLDAEFRAGSRGDSWDGGEAGQCDKRCNPEFSDQVSHGCFSETAARTPGPTTIISRRTQRLTRP
ncbi:hypothetical protein LCM4573_00830 [Rhizobium sp. LCM 4573]|nr:hypothetical protein LCM4573_00830 [Rhizobium sp. LCM 4573]